MDAADEMEFEALVRTHGTMLIRLAVALTADPGVSEEVVQSALERVFVRWHRLNDPLAYARQVVVNLCRDRGRAACRHEQAGLPLAGAAGTAALTATAIWQVAVAPTAAAAPWTVIARPGGQLSVTIHQLRDPAGLQRRLRADGVPATVRFTIQLSPHPGRFRPPCYYPLPRQDWRLLPRINSSEPISGSRWSNAAGIGS